MKLIQRVDISDFRSISSQSLDVDQGYLPIVGPNNSGKSNVLRALNLFFTGEVEPGRPPDLSRDFHNPGRKSKKEVVISVQFSLPTSFRYRKNIAPGLNETLGRDFTIRKTWIPDPATGGVEMKVAIGKDGGNLQAADRDETARVEQFLNLILFRYHPNHIHPSEVLDSVQGKLQDALLTRLRKTRDIDHHSVAAVFDQMGDLSSQLFEPISKDLQDAAPKLEELELSTPKGLAELLFSFAPKLKVRGGEKLDALLHGSGVQSYLVYLVLAFLDTRYADQFGWQQATIWALEEPEAFLHQALQHKVAEFLGRSAEDDRFQILCTTHSDVFGRYANRGLLCHLGDGKTQWRLLPSRVLAGEAAARGVTPYVHPLLIGAQRALLLVEGKTDRIYMRLAFELFGGAHEWEVRDVASLDPDSRLSGVDGLATYLEANRPALRARPLESPIFVLLDWNEKVSKRKKLEDAVGSHPTCSVFQWQESDLNDQLSQQFTGIERSLSTDFIRAASDAGLLDLTRPAESEYPLGLKDRKAVQKVAVAEFADKRHQVDDFGPFKGMVDRLNQGLQNAKAEGRKILQSQVVESEQVTFDL